MKWFSFIATVALSVCLVSADDEPKAEHKATSESLDPVKVEIVEAEKVHNKRGLFNPAPTFSQGYDHATIKHSILKPFVVEYPVQSVKLGVKIPLRNHHHHGKHGHGVKFPSHSFNLPTHNKPGWTKNCHHHHHPAPPPPKPIVPTNTALFPTHIAPAPAPAPILPQPALTFVPRPVHRPLLPLHPPVFGPAPFLPAPTQFFPVAAPVLPAPVPLLPAPVPVIPAPAPFVPAPTHFLPTPVHPVPHVPVAHVPQPHVIRPGHSLHTSFFATYPRFPFVNGLRPIPAPAHIPLGVAAHAPPAHIPINFGHFPLNVIKQHPPIGQIPINFAHLPVNIGHHAPQPLVPQPLVPQPFAHQPLHPQQFIPHPFAQQPFAQQPFAHQPFAQQPFAHQPFAQQPFGPQPFAPQPFIPQPGPHHVVPQPLSPAQPPVAAGQSPANVALGFGNFPFNFGQHSLFDQHPGVQATQPAAPQAPGVVQGTPNIQDAGNGFFNGINLNAGNDNVWTPMANPATDNNNPTVLQYPENPQFAQPEQGQAAFPTQESTEGTQILDQNNVFNTQQNNDQNGVFQFQQNEQNQGYHYQQNGGPAFEEGTQQQTEEQQQYDQQLYIQQQQEKFIQQQQQLAEQQRQEQLGQQEYEQSEQQLNQQQQHLQHQQQAHEQQQYLNQQQYLSAQQQASSNPQHEPQFPQALPDHPLSGRPISQAFVNHQPQRQRQRRRRPARNQAAGHP